MIPRFLAASLFLALTACATAVPVAGPPPDRPLDTLPGKARLDDVRADLLTSARTLYDASTLDHAERAPAMLIAKRFVGMAPPPPPGASPDWRPPTPTVILARENGRWMVAQAGGGWRPAASDRAAEIDRLLARADFWAEPALTPACPDYGANNLLLRTPARPETVRSAQCTGLAASLVQAALGA